MPKDEPKVNLPALPDAPTRKKRMSEEEYEIEMEEYRNLQREYLRRITYEQYRYYEPSGKGEEFIDAFACGDFFVVLYSAANGVGKTATATNILAHMMWNTGENEYFNGKLFTDFPYKKLGRIVSDPTNITKNIIPGLKEWFPHGRYQTRKGDKHFESIWEADTGWAFDVMTYEQDVKEFEGVTLGWAWFDEPPPEAIFKATVSRMRKGGIIFITATPLAGSAYMYDAFAKGSLKIEITASQSGATEVYERKVAYIEADIESACREHGVRGHLKHEDILRMIAEYSEDEKQARIYGKFQHLVGLVFKRFDRKIHVIKPFNITMHDFTVWQALDTHPRNPDACLWVAVDPKGTKYIIDELYVKAAVGELAAKIKAKDSQYRVVKRLLEPAAYIKNQHDEDGKSLADRLADNGLSYEEATKQRTQSNKRIEEAFEYAKVEDHMLRAPEIYIFENCVRTIFEIEHFRWDEYTGRNADKHNAKESPIDKDDHMIEDLGRILIQEPAFEPIQYGRDEGIKDNLDPYA